MQTGPKVMLGSAVLLLLVGGGEFAWRSYQNEQANKPVEKTDNYKSDPDDLVFLKQKHPTKLADEKELKGSTLWVAAGGQMQYFPWNGHSADLLKSQGVLLGAEPLQIQDAVEQVAPKGEVGMVPTGDRQVLLVFAKPGNPARFATPVGARENGEYTIFTDTAFYYQDPHTLYDFWGAPVWAAIDAHKVIPGMTEHQASLAMGQVNKPVGGTVGNRDVIYYNQNHPVQVTFANNKATKIEDVKEM